MRSHSAIASSSSRQCNSKPVVLGLAAAAYMFYGWTLVAGIAALVFFFLGWLWMHVERRRVRRMEAEWHQEHSVPHHD
ncbi:hypothetical protein [Mycobacteroides abscessus]|uniref:hypothetical protein n=1 Tax=Mycobacteroides abscessus TaxID=36809 RepID=UPI00210303BE|nr:hypothetical protein [Mycobacteroides abscessus]